jgi:hypothetical protein
MALKDSWRKIYLQLFAHDHDPDSEELLHNLHITPSPLLFDGLAITAALFVDRSDHAAGCSS